MNTLVDVAKEVAGVFDELNVPYAIMGGLAARSHAIPRPTWDVDFSAVLSADRLCLFVERMEAAGYVVPEPYRNGWVDQVGNMPVVKVRLWMKERTIDVDIFLAENPHQVAAMQRRRLGNVEGQELWVVSAEDLIVFKLIANRPRDFADILDILLIQGELDWGYIDDWAQQLGVSKRWQEARDYMQNGKH